MGAVGREGPVDLAGARREDRVVGRAAGRQQAAVGVGEVRRLEVEVPGKEVVGFHHLPEVRREDHRGVRREDSLGAVREHRLGVLGVLARWSQ